MNKKDCEKHKEAEIWRPQVCRWCIARKCGSREYSYDLAGRRKSLKTEVKVKIDKHGQYYWDWFGDE